MVEVSIPFVHSLIIVDADGDRILAKYYDGKEKSEQIKFEALLHKKSKVLNSKTEAEILIIENELVVVKSGLDCKFYLAGPIDENDLVLVGVLDTVFDTVSSLLKGSVEKRAMYDSMELILLTIDESIDHGYIMELESSSIVSRVLMKSSESGGTTTATQQPSSLGDLTISQALGLAREQFLKSLGGSSRGNDGY